MAPRFITFEGIDGSGKSTQSRRFADLLRAQGTDLIFTREPGGSAGAEEIRNLVLTGQTDRWSAETEILLFTAARRDHLEKTIKPALDAGTTVICDRFADSTRVYQGATRGDLRAKVDALHALMIGMEPDLTFIIDMDPAVAGTRSCAPLWRGPFRGFRSRISRNPAPRLSHVGTGIPRPLRADRRQPHRGPDR